MTRKQRICTTLPRTRPQGLVSRLWANVATDNLIIKLVQPIRASSRVLSMLSASTYVPSVFSLFYLMVNKSKKTIETQRARARNVWRESFSDLDDIHVRAADLRNHNGNTRLSPDIRASDSVYAHQSTPPPSIYRTLLPVSTKCSI